MFVQLFEFGSELSLCYGIFTDMEKGLCFFFFIEVFKDLLHICLSYNFLTNIRLFLENN